VEAFDGRETAPAAADEKLFLGADGKPMPFYDGVVGGRSVGVPGTVRMLEMAHRQHGKLAWAELFKPAITLAEGGFKVSARLNTCWQEREIPRQRPGGCRLFLQSGRQALARGPCAEEPGTGGRAAQAIAAKGSKALLEGEVAQAIVDKVQKHPTNPGRLSLSDLAGYQPRKRTPICHDYAAVGKDYRICGFPPPSSGAIAVGQILGILSNTQAASLPLQAGVPTPAGPTPSADWLFLYTEAARLAFADRALYLGDPDFVQPPAGNWMSLLDPAYLAGRAKLIGQAPGAQSMKVAQPGNPGAVKTSYAPMAPQPEYGTSHISIVDAQGNALAMTTTIEDVFGARQMVKGFLLNNELTDFSFAPTDADGKPVANRVQPGKRPRSSMAPTLVFDKASGQFLLSGGSPGGAVIIHYVAKTLYGTLNWGLTPQRAIDLPNFGSLNGPSLLEEKRFPAPTVDALRTRGAEVREQNMTSGLQAIMRGTVNGQPVLLGGADPRREGVVMGD
jgi:gamma-glutamyltranspeptidase/glutathione hydrolase